jgi:hypothetical protein
VTLSNAFIANPLPAHKELTLLMTKDISLSHTAEDRARRTGHLIMLPIRSFLYHSVFVDADFEFFVEETSYTETESNWTQKIIFDFNIKDTLRTIRDKVFRSADSSSIEATNMDGPANTSYAHVGVGGCVFAVFVLASFGSYGYLGFTRRA